MPASTTLGSSVVPDPLAPVSGLPGVTTGLELPSAIAPIDPTAPSTGSPTGGSGLPSPTTGGSTSDPVLPTVGTPGTTGRLTGGAIDPLTGNVVPQSKTLGAGDLNVDFLVNRVLLPTDSAAGNLSSTDLLPSPPNPYWFKGQPLADTPDGAAGLGIGLPERSQTWPPQSPSDDSPALIDPEQRDPFQARFSQLVSERLQQGQPQEAIIVLDDSAIQQGLTVLQIEKAVSLQSAEALSFRSQGLAALKQSVLASLPAGDVTVLANYEYLPVLFVRLSSSAAADRLLQNDTVLKIEENRLTSLAEAAASPQSAPAQPTQPPANATPGLNTTPPTTSANPPIAAEPSQPPALTTQPPVSTAQPPVSQAEPGLPGTAPTATNPPSQPIPPAAGQSPTQPESSPKAPVSGPAPATPPVQQVSFTPQSDPEPTPPSTSLAISPPVLPPAAPTPNPFMDPLTGEVVRRADNLSSTDLLNGGLLQRAPLNVLNSVVEGKVQELIVVYNNAAIEQKASIAAVENGLDLASSPIIDLKAREYTEQKDAIEATLPAGSKDTLADYDHLPVTFDRFNSSESLAQLLKRPDILSVQPVKTYTAQDAESYPLIRQPQAAAAGFQGAGTTIAILDTGAISSVPDLQGRIIYANDFGHWDGLEDEPVVSNRHGTNVSSIAAGVAPASKIAALDVFASIGSNGLPSASDNHILQGLNWVLANRNTYNIASVNMSLGSGGDTAPVADSASAVGIAIGQLRQAGVLSAISSGNNGYINAIGRPGSFTSAVSVGAVHDSGSGSPPDTVASFSNSADFLDLLAPGVLVTGGGSTMSGTSMAAPHVAGAIAVLKAANPSLTADQIEQRLKSTGKLVTDPRNGITTPRIDLAAAVGGASTQPSIAIDDLSIIEGNSGTKSANFTLRLSAATSSTVSTYVSTTGNTATAWSDFAPVGSTVTFAPGQTTQTFSVPIYGDTTVESNEAFLVNLSSVTGATVADGQAIGTILNDDTVTPSLTIDDVSIVEGDTGTRYANFTARLSTPSASTTSAYYSTASNTATGTVDFGHIAGWLNFAPGTTTQTLSVPIYGDTLVEPNESFWVNLTNPSGLIIADSQAVGVILNDDIPRPPVSLTVGDVSLTEGNSGTTYAQFPIILSQASTTPISLTATSVALSGTNVATSGVDFATGGVSLTINPGVTRQIIQVPVYGDLTLEPNETFALRVSGVTGATVLDDEGIGTILNDDLPAITISDLSISEGQSGSQTASVLLNLSAPVATPVSVGFSTANGSALAGSDYGSVWGTATFAPGQTTQRIGVPIYGDTIVEPNETLFVNLSNAANATIADGQANLFILNDDIVALPSLTIGDAAITEGNSGTKAATFSVDLSRPATSTVAVRYSTANGSAISGSDYLGQSGLLTFAPGVTRQTLTVPVIGDLTLESNETFFVNLAMPSGATLLDSQGLGTIINDDLALPTFSINDVTTNEGNSGSKSINFVVSLSRPTSTTTSVTLSTVGQTASPGSDYQAVTRTLSFAPGQVSQVVPITIFGDFWREPHESFQVWLQNSVNASIFDNLGVGTILNDD